MTAALNGQSLDVLYVQVTGQSSEVHRLATTYRYPGIAQKYSEGIDSNTQNPVCRYGYKALHLPHLCGVQYCNLQVALWESVGTVSE